MEAVNNLDNVRLEESSLQGRGLFAMRDFKRGDMVLGWNEENRYVSELNIRTLPEDLKKYVSLYQGKYLLIAEPERFMNHSCDPNTQTDEKGIDIALRDISAGEEITGDYNKFPALVGFVCSCNAVNCKKTVVATQLVP
jgi:uncharacterized protein